jgi:hypothetical protein
MIIKGDWQGKIISPLLIVDCRTVPRMASPEMLRRGNVYPTECPERAVRVD